MNDKQTPVSPGIARFRKYAHERQGSQSTPGVSPVDISQEVARRQQLENENTAQDIRLKRITLNRLFWFLAVETALIFLLAFLQAVKWPNDFGLEEWNFRVLVGATIAQITGMLFVAVRYLFPKK